MKKALRVLVPMVLTNVVIVGCLAVAGVPVWMGLIVVAVYWWI